MSVFLAFSDSREAFFQRPPHAETGLTCTYIVHDPDFRAAFQDFTTFVEKVSEKVIEADETIPELPVKDVVRVTNITLLGSVSCSTNTHT